MKVQYQFDIDGIAFRSDVIEIDIPFKDDNARDAELIYQAHGFLVSKMHRAALSEKYWILED